MIGKYKIICIIGSTKYKSEIQSKAAELTLDGYIVLPLTVFSHSDNLSLSEGQINMLKDMIKKKIDIADEVYVVNPKNTIIGDNTLEEINYALNNNKKVTYMNFINSEGENNNEVCRNYTRTIFNTIC